MQAKSRGTATQEYSEKDVITKLKALYGNCIHIGENLYIVCSKGKYYLMPKTIPEVFETKKATRLRKLISMKEDVDGTIEVNIRKGDESKEFIMTTKPRLIERLSQWT